MHSFRSSRSSRSFLATLSVCAAALFVSGCGSGDHHSDDERSIGSLRLIGEQRLAFKQPLQNTVIGGLSGIDYDPVGRGWIVISDDRSDNSPARFYSVKLAYEAQSFSSLTVDGVTLFKQADGSPYPNGTTWDATRAGEVPDLESIRFDPKDSSIWYTSEGDRSRAIAPSTRHADATGALSSVLPTPPMFAMRPTQEVGPRNNMAFEGLSFSADGNTLWVSLESALYEDGPVATTAAGTVSRFTQYDRNGGIVRQIAYPIDPIPVAPGPGKYGDNGVSEILAINDEQLLVIERSGSQAADDAFSFHIRLYEVDTRDATDVRAMASLQNGGYTPAKKRLILDLDKLGLARVDNIEGATWGPKLANGHDSLVLVSDDNFNSTQVTQFLAFEVLPK
ncbi:MAG: esterase-like activity of phytase family protein [Burkholderiaceae bacterium]